MLTESSDHGLPQGVPVRESFRSRETPVVRTEQCPQIPARHADPRMMITCVLFRTSCPVHHAHKSARAQNPRTGSREGRLADHLRPSWEQGTVLRPRRIAFTLRWHGPRAPPRSDSAIRGNPLSPVWWGWPRERRASFISASYRRGRPSARSCRTRASTLEPARRSPAPPRGCQGLRPSCRSHRRAAGVQEPDDPRRPTAVGAACAAVDMENTKIGHRTGTTRPGR